MERPPVPAAAAASVAERMNLKVGLLLGATLALLVAFAGYVLYARGVFEPTQRLTLVAANVDGVVVGMDMTFAGFTIGRVRRIALANDGKARIEVAVPRSDARWLRESSVFTLERSLVGGARIRAFSGDLNAPPLPDDAVRNVLVGDTTEEIPLLVANLRNILANVERMTGATSNLNASIASLQVVAERMAGKHGALEAALGNAADAAKVIGALERTNALLASLQGVATKMDSTVGKVDAAVGKADQRVFGAGGMADEAQAALAEGRKAVLQVNAILEQSRASLQRLDAVLANAQDATANLRSASVDLAPLRAEVESNLRRIGQLIEEVNRKWPFERDTGLRLP